MEMFLMALVLSLLGVAVSAGLFAAATHGMPRSDEQQPDLVSDRLADVPSRFFVSDRSPAAQPPVPMEALLLQIAQHVRLEQAAAESFHFKPTAASLHTRTTSPLVH